MASWSPLAKVSDYISGKVDHGKVYCACGKEARHFTVVGAFAFQSSAPVLLVGSD